MTAERRKAIADTIIEVRRLRVAIKTALVPLGHLHRGEWATNKERDALIDEAYAALEGK